MAAGTLNVYWALEWTDSTQTIVAGSKTTPVAFTYSDGLKYSGTATIAAATVATLFDIGASEAVASADFIAITADQDFGVCLEGSSEANNSTAAFKAGQVCIVSQGQIYTYDANGDFNTTTKVAIASVAGRNESATTAATFRWWVWS